MNMGLISNKAFASLQKGLFGVLLTYSFNSSATTSVDVYGVDSLQAEKIVKQYASQVSLIENLLLAAFEKVNNKKFDKELEKLLLKKKRLIDAIKKEGNYLHVAFDTVFYPKSGNQYITIEIISRDQASRLRFLDSHVAESQARKGMDVIEQMHQFVNQELHLMMTGQLKEKYFICPVYHCISSFNRPETKPYLALFNRAAVEEKKLIIDTLNHSHDPERRAAAVFLVGHFHDPKEIIQLLEMHVNDGNSVVRNNVMRVIASVMRKTKIAHIHVRPFLPLLDSPQDSDRNKALAVLSTVAQVDPEKQLIIQEGGDKLLNLLRLKQPNNHDLAYKILKKISAKDFANDIARWKQWLAMYGNRTKKM